MASAGSSHALWDGTGTEGARGRERVGKGQAHAMHPSSPLLPAFLLLRTSSSPRPFSCRRLLACSLRRSRSAFTGRATTSQPRSAPEDSFLDGAQTVSTHASRRLAGIDAKKKQDATCAPCSYTCTVIHSTGRVERACLPPWVGDAENVVCG